MLALISQQNFVTPENNTMLWLLVCAGLVFLMQPGFMCLESGLTRSKNSINVAVKNLADFGISLLLFWLLGYGLMFGASATGWWGTSEFAIDASRQPDVVAFFVFQAMFCSTATTIVSGAVAERLRFVAYLAIAVLVSGCIYPLFGNWAWNGLNAGTSSGWLGQLGFIDFAGSTVVHSAGAWVSLAALLVVGARGDRFPDQAPPQKIQGANLPMAVLGVMLLWFGWIGFNGGSTLQFNSQVAGIIMNTMIAGASGMVVTGALTFLRYRHIEVELVMNGSIAGLVAITASCHAVSTSSAVLIGGMGGAVMLLMSRMLEKWRIDDAVDAVAVHGAAGAWGTLSVGLFGQMDLLGTSLSRPALLGVQALGIVTCFVWAFGLTWLILSGFDRFFPVRVSARAEELGLNVSEHRAKTEIYDLFQVMEEQAETQDLSLRVPANPFTEVGHIARRYNQVIDALERKTNDILLYLEHVNVVTAAATAVEADTFQPSSLGAIAIRTDELGRLARVFQRMFQQVKLREHRLQKAQEQIAQANETLEQRVVERTVQLEEANAEIVELNQQLSSDNLRMSAELNITRRLQKMMLPTENELEAIAGLDIAGFMEPATEVGGDYYDVWQQEGHVRIGIGDVTGHGLESGVVMLMAQTAVRALLASGETDPARLLNAVNRTIYDNTRRMESYKNMTIALLDYEAGVLRLSGQHEELIIVRQNGEIEIVDTIDLGFPLGLESDISSFIDETCVQLQPNDVAVLYTDGITEAVNIEREQYGLNRLYQVLIENRHADANAIRRAVIQNVLAHVGEATIFDDLTLVILKPRE
ncbi:MAG: ammonium transporter [Elainellaceae cyanobacterium]